VFGGQEWSAFSSKVPVGNLRLKKAPLQRELWDRRGVPKWGVNAGLGKGLSRKGDVSVSSAKFETVLQLRVGQFVSLSWGGFENRIRPIRKVKR